MKVALVDTAYQNKYTYLKKRVFTLILNNPAKFEKSEKDKNAFVCGVALHISQQLSPTTQILLQ